MFATWTYLMFVPEISVGDPQDGRGDVASLPHVAQVAISDCCSCEQRLGRDSGLHGSRGNEW